MPEPPRKPIALSCAVTRRQLLVGAGVVAGAVSRSQATAAAPASRAAPAEDTARLDPMPIDDPHFNIDVIAKLQGDLSGRQRYLYNPGCVYGILPTGQGLAAQEFGRLLYRVDGFTARISRKLGDGSVEERSHSWMLYSDALTGEPLQQWTNPYNGERVAVPEYRGGPSASRLTTNGPALQGMTGLESTALGSPVHLQWRVVGPRTWLSRHASSRIRIGSGRARNEFSVDAWACATADLRDRQRSSIPSTYTWTSHAEWQPWLRMQDRPGGVLWRIDTVLLDDRDQLPRSFIERIDKILPGKLDQKLQF